MGGAGVEGAAAQISIRIATLDIIFVINSGQVGNGGITAGNIRIVRIAVVSVGNTVSVAVKIVIAHGRVDTGNASCGGIIGGIGRSGNGMGDGCGVRSLNNGIIYGANGNVLYGRAVQDKGLGSGKIAAVQTDLAL